MNLELSRYLQDRARLVNRALRTCLPVTGRAPMPFLKPAPATLREAMLYSLRVGGKRLRPILTLAAADACGARPGLALGAACAMELIHTYSLIHDDLPAMDDDDLRRGRPTSHIVFGEAGAILAGDALLTAAFELLADNARRARLSSAAACDLVGLVAAAAGARGMVGGQAADIEAEGFDGREASGRAGRRAAALLDYIHTHKTAALIAASVEAGAVVAGASPARRAALRGYARRIGLAFQIADDILDVVGDKEKLGKRGSDSDNRKLTYARLHGIEASRRRAARLAAGAAAAVATLGRRGRMLALLAGYVIERDS